MEGAERGRLVGRRMGDRPLGNNHLNGIEKALVLDDGGIHRRHHLHHDVTAAVAEGVPDAYQFGAIIGAGQVHRQLIARDGTGHMDSYVLGALRVVVDEDIGRVNTVGPFCDLLAHAFFSVLYGVIDRALTRSEPHFADQLLQPPHGMLHAANHGGQITRETMESGYCARAA